MKIKTLLVLLTAILFSSPFTFAQEKISIAAGFGFPELLNAGIRFNGLQKQYTLSVGTFPKKDESTLAISGDFYFHFGGHAKLSERRPWFGKAGLNFFRADTEFLIEEYVYLILSMGREFNLSKKLGMQVCIGTVFELDNEITLKGSTLWDDNVSTPILPSLSFATFYKL